MVLLTKVNIFKSLGIPITIQWDINGYFYPIQIAQYGLSHYSKNLIEKPVQYNMYENGEHSIQVY